MYLKNSMSSLGTNISKCVLLLFGSMSTHDIGRQKQVTTLVISEEIFITFAYISTRIHGEK